MASRLKLALGWIFEVLYWIDEGLNLLITPFQDGAYADETMSSRAWRMDKQRKPWGRMLRPTIDAAARLFGQTDHCRKALETRRRRLQAALDSIPK